MKYPSHSHVKLTVIFYKSSTWALRFLLLWQWFFFSAFGIFIFHLFAIGESFWSIAFMYLKIPFSMQLFCAIFCASEQKRLKQIKYHWSFLCKKKFYKKNMATLYLELKWKFTSWVLTFPIKDILKVLSSVCRWKNIWNIPKYLKRLQIYSHKEIGRILAQSSLT